MVCQSTHSAEDRRAENCRLLQPSVVQAVGGEYLPSGKRRLIAEPHLPHWKAIHCTRGLILLILTTVPFKVTSFPMQEAFRRRICVAEAE